MEQNLRKAIAEYLEAEVRRYWLDQQGNQTDTSYKEKRAFHAAIAPKAMFFWNTASSQSFYTRSGSWWQNISQMVAATYHQNAKIGYKVQGALSAAADAYITEIDSQLNQKNRKPKREKDIDEVLTVQSGGGQSRTETSDLFFQRDDGTEMYFEIKTPEPNKAHSREMKRRILSISALKKGKRVEVYGACAYNPSGDGNPYNPDQKYVFQFLEVHQDFLVGREFWEKVGDERTYDDLLEIWSEVGPVSNDLFADLMK